MTPAIPSEEPSSERQQSSGPAAEASSAEEELSAQPAKLTKGMHPADVGKAFLTRCRASGLRDEHVELSIPHRPVCDVIF